MRFFYEDYPHLYVIVTGSLLEFAMEQIARMPVGRVGFPELHPLNFQEYLSGIGNQALLNALHHVPLFKTRKVKEAINALEKAKILELIYPTTNASLPDLPDFKKSPRLQYLDIGLVNFQLGLHRELLVISDLNDSSRGKFIRQVVMQELKSLRYVYCTNLWIVAPTTWQCAFM
jgi:predicted AAA+ superfamily ATPase